MTGPHPLCKLEASRAEIDGHRVVDASIGQRGQRHQSDRSTTKDRHLVTRLRFGLVDGLHPHGEWLRERRRREGHVIGKSEEPASIRSLGDVEQGSEATITGSRPERTVTDVQRAHNHTITDGQIGNLVPKPLDHTDDLVTKGDWATGIQAHVDVRHVRAANTARGDAD